MDKGYRISKDEYYLKIAESTLERSTCLRRKYGAVIVNNDEIISTGYNGAPRGELNCVDTGICERERLGIPKGERYELCVAVHAEQNAIISAARKDMVGGTIYIVGKEVATGEYANPAPCLICRRMIVNAGIKRCVGIVDGTIQEINIKQLKKECDYMKVIDGKTTIELTLNEIKGIIKKYMETQGFECASAKDIEFRIYAD